MFLLQSEAQLQDKVASAIAYVDPKIWIEREVRAGNGRYDILCQRDGASVVLELKLHASPASVERQAQRYALRPEVDAVGVVTTSRRLAHGLGTAEMLGGKPFFVVALRTT